MKANKIRSDINSAKAHIRQLKDDNAELYFTQKDIEILLPKYEKILADLERELGNTLKNKQI